MLPKTLSKVDRVRKRIPHLRVKRRWSHMIDERYTILMQT